MTWAAGGLVGSPPNSASNLGKISSHLDDIFGDAGTHLHEIYSPDIHVDLIHYMPSVKRDFHYIVTSGMSDRPLTNAGDPVDEPYIELALALPASWNVSPAGFKNPATWQPVKMLKMLARYPHNNGTFFADGHSIPAGTEPLVAPMVAILLMPPTLPPELREPLSIGKGIRREELDVATSYRSVTPFLRNRLITASAPSASFRSSSS